MSEGFAYEIIVYSKEESTMSTPNMLQEYISRLETYNYAEGFHIFRIKLINGDGLCHVDHHTDL